jgi:FkbM family methyltransferase
MNTILQRGLIGLYRAVKATGVLDTAAGRKIFEASYHIYKDRLEAGPVELLRRWVRPGTVVLDVGANVGFFTLRFASWVSDGGRVIALEPEAVNYEALVRAIAKAGLSGVVETIQAAVSDATGEAKLEVNPGHPGDHKLGDEGVAVATTTVDDLLAARGWPEVSLIKIDVQGAEALVLSGARQALERSRPALFLEVDDAALRRFGSSAGGLLESAVAQGYTIHSRVGEGFSAPLSVAEALSLEGTADYEDLLLLPAGRAEGPAPLQPSTATGE